MARGSRSWPRIVRGARSLPRLRACASARTRAHSAASWPRQPRKPKYPRSSPGARSAAIKAASITSVPEPHIGSRNSAPLAARGAEFLDPMCGSGTLVIEAALIAAERAPGLLRGYFGFLGWRGHDAALWARVRAEAQARSRGNDRAPRTIRGQDLDPLAIERARANADRAGVQALVQLEVQALSEAVPLAPPNADHPGLLCTNPPYGMRLEDRETARAVHRELGAVLRERFQGWNA